MEDPRNCSRVFFLQYDATVHWVGGPPLPSNCPILPLGQKIGQLVKKHPLLPRPLTIFTIKTQRTPSSLLGIGIHIL
jgi:hypothetical protein